MWLVSSQPVSGDQPVIERNDQISGSVSRPLLRAVCCLISKILWKQFADTCRRPVSMRVSCDLGKTVF